LTNLHSNHVKPISLQLVTQLGETAALDQYEALLMRYRATRGRDAVIHFSDEGVFFEGFYHLYYKWTWAVPCAYGEPGVSLFEQWKAVAALVFAFGGAAEPDGEFTLVGGDIPGIQSFVYTITSKGAAKGLQGFIPAQPLRPTSGR
jgi:CRISPR/Cas system-associated protein Cas10 (large subunit of type III CRISPR-Cas system)